MQLDINLTLDNAAFEEDERYGELTRILRTVAARVDDGEPGGFLRDGNGNTVGEFIVTE